jgi:hypothetical protein
MANPDNRTLMAAELSGYLMAAMELCGVSSKYHGSAVLIPLEGRAIEVALRDQLAEWGEQLVSIREGSRWTEVEGALRNCLLPAPLGDPALAQHANAARVRHMLAWRATDLIMFLSPAQKPLAMYYLQIERPDWVDQAWAVRYENDALLVCLSEQVG